MTRSQITQKAMSGPFSMGPRFGGPKMGKRAPKRKAKLAPDKGGRRYLGRMG